MTNNSLWDSSFQVKFSDNNYWKSKTGHSHYHNSYEIYFLVENDVLYFIDDKSYLIKEGMVVVVPPNVIHSTCSVNDEPRKRFLIYLPEEFINEFLRHDPDLLNRLSNRPFMVNPSKRQKLINLFQKNLIEYQKDNSNLLLQKSFLVETLVELDKLANEDLQENIIINEDKKESKTIFTIANYISVHFDENITLDTLSSKFFLHPSYISRSFKKYLNISFSEFLKKVRINEVIVLLIETNDKISVIAQKTGFESTSSLCRAFKESKGISPLQYRKNQKRGS